MRDVSDEKVTATYTTQISKARLPPADMMPSVGEWVDGLRLSLSIVGEEALTITLGDVDLLGGPDNATFADLVAADGNELVINFDLEEAADIVCRQFSGMYLTGRAILDASGATFAGVVTSTCADRSGAGAYAWRGGTSDTAALTKVRNKLRKLSKKFTPAEGRR